MRCFLKRVAPFETCVRKLGYAVSKADCLVVYLDEALRTWLNRLFLLHPFQYLTDLSELSFHYRIWTSLDIRVHIPAWLSSLHAPWASSSSLTSVLAQSQSSFNSFDLLCCHRYFFSRTGESLSPWPFCYSCPCRIGHMHCNLGRQACCLPSLDVRFFDSWRGSEEWLQMIWQVSLTSSSSGLWDYNCDSSRHRAYWMPACRGWGLQAKVSPRNYS